MARRSAASPTRVDVPVVTAPTAHDETQVRAMLEPVLAGRDQLPDDVVQVLEDLLDPAQRSYFEVRLGTDARSPRILALPSTCHPTLAELPWEAVDVLNPRKGYTPLLERNQVDFVRLVQPSGPAAEARRARGARVLLLVGDVEQGADRHAGTAALAAQIKMVREAVATTEVGTLVVAAHDSVDQSQLDVAELERFADREALARLFTTCWDVVHFIGHVDEAQADGVLPWTTGGLQFTDALVVTSQDLQVWLRQAHSAVLVVAGCMLSHAFAAPIAACGVHVVGHALRVVPDFPEAWTPSFYEALLARDGSLVAAVRAARTAVRRYGGHARNAWKIRHWANTTESTVFLDERGHAVARYRAARLGLAVVRDELVQGGRQLDELYVELVAQPEGASFDRDAGRSANRTLLESVRGLRPGEKAVLRGDAGSGKTTSARGVEHAIHEEGTWFVWHATFRDWPDTGRGKAGRPTDFESHFKEGLGHFGKSSADHVWQAFQEHLSAGTALVVLDGLDEVDEARGQSIIAALGAAASRLRLLVTTRRTKIGEHLLADKGWTEWALRPLDERQQDAFFERARVAFGARPSAGQTPEGARAEFFAAIGGRTSDVARSPFLLVLACSLWCDAQDPNGDPRSADDVRQRDRLINRSIERVMRRSRSVEGTKPATEKLSPPTAAEKTRQLAAARRAHEDVALLATIRRGSSPFGGRDLAIGADSMSDGARTMLERRLRCDLAQFAGEDEAAEQISTLAEWGLLHAPPSATSPGARRTKTALPRYGFTHNLYREHLAAMALARVLPKQRGAVVSSALDSVQGFLTEVGLAPNESVAGQAAHADIDRWADVLAAFSWHLRGRAGAQATWCARLATFDSPRLLWRTLIAGGLEDPTIIAKHSGLAATKSPYERRELYARIAEGQVVSDVAEIAQALEALAGVIAPDPGSTDGDERAVAANEAVDDLATLDAWAEALAVRFPGHASDLRNLRNELSRRVRPVHPRPTEAGFFASCRGERAKDSDGSRLPWLVEVPAGAFTMGSDSRESRRRGNDGPWPNIPVGTFWIAREAITVAQYRRFDPAKGFHGDGDDLPARWISWFEACLYCRALTRWAIDHPEAFQSELAKDRELHERLQKGHLVFRLPKEAELEYVMRWSASGLGTHRGAYGVGTDEVEITEQNLTLYAVFSDNSGDKPRPVGSKLSTTPGRLFDLHGNVWEWCLDAYETDTPRVAADAVHGGPPDASRVLRGGGFGDVDLWCRASIRDDCDPEWGNGDLGFRVVLAPPLSPLR
jgi:formylglycine-generating enzyme required for sulfatase activity